MPIKTDFGILYYEDRRPPYRKQKAVIQRPLVCSSGCWDLGVNAGDALGGSSRRRLCENVLRYLIAILNKNTLVPSARRPHGRRKGGARLAVAQSNSN
jgi:hypothetical protein